MSLPAHAAQATLLPLSSAPTQAEVDGWFLAQLDQLAEYARMTMSWMLRMNSRLTGEFVTPRAQVHESQAAAFEAFVDLGGDGADPLAFPWHDAERLDALRHRALIKLRAAYFGKRSDYGDIRARWSVRRDVARVDGLAWDSWKYAPRGTNEPMQGGGEWYVSVVEATTPEQEIALHAQEMGLLLAAVADVLTPREFRWLREREYDGIPQATQIQALCAEDPRYADPDGPRRAEILINTTVSRARGKARARLGAQWAELLPDIQQ